jgi:adenylosuccinate synthetase
LRASGAARDPGGDVHQQAPSPGTGTDFGRARARPRYNNRVWAMSNIVILGAQWGDEGKGKIVDLFCDHFDIVARYQGGHNAGHTVLVGDKKFILKLIP